MTFLPYAPARAGQPESLSPAARRSQRPFRASAALSLALAALLGLGATEAAAAPDAARATAAAKPAKPAKSGLKPLKVKSLNHLKRLLKGKMPKIVKGGMMPVETAMAGGGDVSRTQFSTTNTQVQGVDEGDIVKTDGQYIYTVQGGELRIVQAYPSLGLSLLASVKFEDGFYPSELYVDGDRLLVIGSRWLADDTPPVEQPAEPAVQSKMAIIGRPFYYMGENLTVARVYNIADRKNPVQEREVSFTGHSVASRKIGDAVYLVGRTYPTFWGMPIYFMAAKTSGAARTSDLSAMQSTLPKVGDSAVNKGELATLSLDQLAYFPDFVDPSYVVVAGFRLSEPGTPADIKGYLGAGDVAYASLDKLYLSAADYPPDGTHPVTHLYSFDIGQGSTQFRKAGAVPGTVLNQFSMDEHQGYFRIATTVNQWTQEGDSFVNTSWNNVYSLDKDMKVAGSLEHLAPGETLYAARFMGDRGYLVTFRQTDPLFALDLSEPTEPKVAGELKLPGFSNYLHPYDEHHLLGIGQETVAVGDFVQTAGLKLALFDVSDLKEPKLLHSLVVGQQGTYSDAFYDHKAVLFDKSRNLLALPVYETDWVSGYDWPTQTFQGAEVFDVTLEGGFQRKAAITQLPEGNPYAWNRYVRRVLTIEDQLYTISEGRIQANALDGEKYPVTGGLDLAPVDPVPVYPVIDPVLVDPVPTDPVAGGTDGTDGAVACTMEAMLCPDGETWVGRTGPSCEFTACPEVK